MMKKLIIAIIASSFLLSLTGLSYAKKYKKRHPRERSVVGGVVNTSKNVVDDALTGTKNIVDDVL